MVPYGPKTSSPLFFVPSGATSGLCRLPLRPDAGWRDLLGAIPPAWAATLQARDHLKRFNIEARVALLSYSNFGSRDGDSAFKMREVYQRLKRVAPYIGDETFCFTYGDGVSDIDISALITAHKSAGREATVTAIQPPGRYGALLIENNSVQHFQEKPAGDGAWINGGFFVLEPSVLQYVDGDDTVWEQAPLQRLAGKGQLTAHQHVGFWQAMDTLREKNLLEDLWASGKAPWKSW